MAPVLQYRRVPRVAHNTHNDDLASLWLYWILREQIRIAEVNSDRTNLSPFTKDYRGWAS